MDPIVCPITYSCVATVAPAGIDLCSFTDTQVSGEFDATDGNYSFNSIDMVTTPPGTYTLQITGSSGAKSESFTVDLVLVDPCFTVNLQLQPSPFTDVSYTLRDDPVSQPWTTEDLISPLTQVNCGPITVELINDLDGSGALEPNLIIDDRTLAPPNQFTVLYTEDVSKHGAYPLSYRVYYTNYPGNVVEQLTPFTVSVVDPCLNPVSVTAPTLKDQEYTITGVVVTYQIPAFDLVPSWCSI